jgi:hypothetical protein
VIKHLSLCVKHEYSDATTMNCSAGWVLVFISLIRAISLLVGINVSKLSKLSSLRQPLRLSKEQMPMQILAGDPTVLKASKPTTIAWARFLSITRQVLSSGLAFPEAAALETFILTFDNNDSVDAVRPKSLWS